MINKERMAEIIQQAKEAALVRDFTPCGMGLSPRVGFSIEVYKATLAALIDAETPKLPKRDYSDLPPRNPETQ